MKYVASSHDRICEQCVRPSQVNCATAGAEGADGADG